MLQTYIFKKTRLIRDGEEEDAHPDEPWSYFAEAKPDPTFTNLTKFWFATRNLMTDKDHEGLDIVEVREKKHITERSRKNRKFLVPSDQQVIDLKEKQMEWLKAIILKEVKLNKYQTLQETICFLILY